MFKQGFTHYSVSCLFKNVKDRFQWIFLGVFGLNENNLRNGL